MRPAEATFTGRLPALENAIVDSSTALSPPSIVSPISIRRGDLRLPAIISSCTERKLHYCRSRTITSG